MTNSTRVISSFPERISYDSPIRHVYAVSVQRRVFVDEGSRLRELKSPRLLPTCGFPAVVARSIYERERKRGTLFVVAWVLNNFRRVVGLACSVKINVANLRTLRGSDATLCIIACHIFSTMTFYDYIVCIAIPFFVNNKTGNLNINRKPK